VAVNPEFSRLREILSFLFKDCSVNSLGMSVLVTLRR